MSQGSERQTTHVQEQEAPEQTDSYREYFEEDRQVALVEEQLEGDRYKAVFKGVGYVEHEQDEGAFLTDVSGINFDVTPETTSEEIDRLINERVALEMRGRMRFDISHLFPYEWMGEGIEYEITVNAKRVDPQQ